MYFLLALKFKTIVRNLATGYAYTVIYVGICITMDDAL